MHRQLITLNIISKHVLFPSLQLYIYPLLDLIGQSSAGIRFLIPIYLFFNSYSLYVKKSNLPTCNSVGGSFNAKTEAIALAIKTNPAVTRILFSLFFCLFKISKEKEKKSKLTFSNNYY
ncbi:MAG: hypothetical protein JSY10_30065 [Paenibacillus sp.]|nr:hypothetical protein [Paenibacillus sp.]